ncbi:MAG: type II 3-dehydroquinate dehydratase [Clostridia bacterium]|nr:type II 3-dehydroquinate dehydratase [Clostridia bacterium]
MKFLIINGVNLNLTGKRETGVYGVKTLEEINAEIGAFAKKNGDEVEFYQSNFEGALVEKLHEAFLQKTCDGILLNAGAFTHYSYALRDAIAAIDIPVVEVHMSNVHAREEFRKNSVLTEVCKGAVLGLGVGSYLAALVGLKAGLKE